MQVKSLDVFNELLQRRAYAETCEQEGHTRVVLICMCTLYLLLACCCQNIAAWLSSHRPRSFSVNWRALPACVFGVCFQRRQLVYWRTQQCDCVCVQVGKRRQAQPAPLPQRLRPGQL